MNYLRKVGEKQIEFIGFSHLVDVVFVKRTIMSHSVVLKTDDKYYYDYSIEINKGRITYNQQFYNDIEELHLFDVQFLFLEDVKSYICTFSNIKSHSD